MKRVRLSYNFGYVKAMTNAFVLTELAKSVYGTKPGAHDFDRRVNDVSVRALESGGLHDDISRLAKSLTSEIEKQRAEVAAEQEGTKKMGSRLAGRVAARWLTAFENTLTPEQIEELGIDPEYASVESFVEHLFDDGRTEYTLEELKALVMSHYEQWKAAGQPGQFDMGDNALRRLLKGWNLEMRSRDYVEPARGMSAPVSPAPLSPPPSLHRPLSDKEWLKEELKPGTPQVVRDPQIPQGIVPKKLPTYGPDVKQRRVGPDGKMYRPGEKPPVRK